MSRHQNPIDKQAPQAGKVENDRNKQGQQEPTQLHQSKRSPESRHDREAQVGSSNQSQVRRSPPSGIGR